MPDAIEHPAVEMTEVANQIHALHDQVCRRAHRVHITRTDCDDVCVMISQKELEHLEQALDLLANSDSFTTLCKNLNGLLQNAGMVYGQEEPSA